MRDSQLMCHKIWMAYNKERAETERMAAAKIRHQFRIKSNLLVSESCVSAREKNMPKSNDEINF